MKTKISKAINEYAAQHNMGCMLHDWVEYSKINKHGYAGYYDYDDERRETQFITMHLFGEGKGNAIHVFGVASDGGRGAFYGTIII